MIYLDTSALLKLVHEEPESAALERWLVEREGTPVVSSQLAAIEVIRACRRMNPDTLAEARSLLAGIDLVPLAGDVVDQAADRVDALLDGSGAVHLASALCIRSDLSALVVYDERLAGAARAVGLDPSHPGA